MYQDDNEIQTHPQKIQYQNGIKSNHYSRLHPLGRRSIRSTVFNTPTTIVQYVQEHTEISNSTEEKRFIDVLYIRRSDNGSSNTVFKLNTKEPLTMNRITGIPMTEDFNERIDHIRTKDGQQ